jgi:hypothetical protein
MPKFIPGLQLSELFYKEVVKELIDKEFPNLEYSAALIGHGSEVLGFDTPRSTDHHWGPRLMLFLSKNDFNKRKAISVYLSKKLPSTFRGFSTHFGNPNEIGVQLLTQAKEGQPINHRIEIFTIQSFFKDYLQIDIDKKISIFDWLTISEQKLRTIQSGKIFYDKIGLKKDQSKLGYFPEGVWLYMLASEWSKIGQEEQFVGRCGDVGDELGSKIIAGRIVQTIMRLCFTMEKEYIPYSKWFGTAFLKLNCAKEISPILNHVLAAKGWKKRERYLAKAYKIIAFMHNKLKITKPLTTDVSDFHDRPYKVIHGDVFASEIRKKIKDSSIKRIPANIGSVSQFSNTVELITDNTILKRIKTLYQ